MSFSRFVVRGDRVVLAHDKSPTVGTVTMIATNGDAAVNWDRADGDPPKVTVHPPIDLAHSIPNNLQRYETPLPSGRVLIRHKFPVGSRIQYVETPTLMAHIYAVTLGADHSPRYETEHGDLDVEAVDLTWRMVQP